MIPTIRQWSNHQDIFMEIVKFKNNLVEKLELEANEATENDIVFCLTYNSLII